jgi:hypothetical protein
MKPKNCSRTILYPNPTKMFQIEKKSSYKWKDTGNCVSLNNMIYMHNTLTQSTLFGQKKHPRKDKKYRQALEMFLNKM